MTFADGTTWRLNDFCTRSLRPNESIKLESGIVISFDGSVLRVGATEIKWLNSIIDSKGEIYPNSFIRTFD